MLEIICFIIPIVFCLTSSLAQPTSPVIRYLRGVHRLNDASYNDFYFSCSTVGATLQWQIDENIIGGFSGGNTGNVLTSSGQDSGSTATLLSSQPRRQGGYLFDSILVVSTRSDDEITVSCLSDVELNSTTNRAIAIAQNEILNATAPNVFLQFLFSASIVNMSMTYVYLCGVNNNSQQWQADDQSYMFSSQDPIGQDRQLLSTDQTVLNQAILIGREPYQLITILLLTGIPGVNVSCSSNNFQETLLFSDVLSSVMSSVMATEPLSTTMGDISTTDTTAIRGTESSTPTSSNSVVVLLAIVITVAAAVVVAVVVTIVVAILIVLHKRQKRATDEAEKQKNAEKEKNASRPQSAALDTTVLLST